MEILRMLVGLFLLITAALVAGQFVAAPLYSSVGNAATVVWYYLNIPVAVALVITLAVQLYHKRLADRVRGDGLGRARLEANVLFYAALLASLWFFRNWLDFLATIPDGSQSTADLILWDLLNPLVVIVVGITGGQLWRNSLPGGSYSGGGRS